MSATNLESLLVRLGRSFTVKDLMVPAEYLVKASSVENAIKKLEGYPDFDTIPVVKGGKIDGYVVRGANELSRVTIEDVISDGTSIKDLLEELATKQFLFVITGSYVSGFVHFSDLNNRVVKMQCYMIFQALEEGIVKKIADIVNESDIEKVAGKERFEILKKRMRHQKSNRSNLGWTGLLYFSELLKIARIHGKTDLAVDDINELSRFRNVIAHADRPLIEKHSDVRRLAGILKKALDANHKVRISGLQRILQRQTKIRLPRRKALKLIYAEEKAQ